MSQGNWTYLSRLPVGWELSGQGTFGAGLYQGVEGSSRCWLWAICDFSENI